MKSNYFSKVEKRPKLPTHEEIKKGCELIKEYDYYENHEVVYLTENGNSYNLLDMEDQAESKIVYRDFLQLVIRAINKKYRSAKAYTYGIDQTRDSISIVYDSKTAYEILETFYYFDMSEEEAQEKAISYVFKHMED